eukprot:365727-Chlamydomonas_euryale.AAC.1
MQAAAGLALESPAIVAAQPMDRAPAFPAFPSFPAFLPGRTRMHAQPCCSRSAAAPSGVPVMSQDDGGMLLLWAKGKRIGRRLVATYGHHMAAARQPHSSHTAAARQEHECRVATPVRLERELAMPAHTAAGQLLHGIRPHRRAAAAQLRLHAR